MSSLVGIYKIVSPNESAYVGMTLDSFESRFSGHQKALRLRKHKCKGLQRAANKYGVENLHLEILEKWLKPESRNTTFESLVLLRERDWWDKLKSQEVNLYNGRPTGTGSVYHTEESRKRIAETNRRKTLDPLISRLSPNLSEFQTLVESKNHTQSHIMERFSLSRSQYRIAKDYFGFLKTPALAIDDRPELTRKIQELKATTDLSNIKIAELLGISEGTVRYRVKHASLV